MRVMLTALSVVAAATVAASFDYTTGGSDSGVPNELSMLELVNKDI